MYKFIISIVIFASFSCVYAAPRPGDFRDAVEEVEVPPQHRAAPPQSAQPSIPLFPRALYPVMPGTYPLFFPNSNGFVPFARTYDTYPAIR